MPPVSFSTIVQPDPDGVLLIEVPAHVMAALSDKKRIPVNVTLNGGKFYWRSQQRTRSRCADSLPARKEIREAA